MKPVKAKHLIKDVAEELDVPLDVANEVITSYWKEVRSSLSEMKYPYITVHNFGVFTIKHWALQKEKEKLINIRESLKDRVYKFSQTLVESLDRKIKLIEEMMFHVEHETQRKEFIKIHKKNAKRNI